MIFIVMNPEGGRKLVQDSVKLGAEMSVAAGPVGRSAEGATDAQFHAEILSYSRTRGLFAGMRLDGAVVKQDKDDNEKLYGRKITAKEILIDGEVVAPPEARALDDALAKYSPRADNRSRSVALSSAASSPDLGSEGELHGCNRITGFRRAGGMVSCAVRPEIHQA